MKFKYLLIGVFSLFTILACKKTEPIIPTISPSNPGTRAELTKDSIYLYAQQVYLWNTGMPTYANFNPRQYATNDDVLEAIINLKTPGKPIDKYSFIDGGTTAAAIGGGVSGDYGFSVVFTATDDLRVKFVYPNSPAAQAGIGRGDRIIAFDGQNNIVASSQTVIDVLNKGLFGNSTSITLTVKKLDGSTKDATIIRKTYNISPILFNKVFTVGSKKVGYIVYNSFTANSVQALDAVFANFASENITEVIVDLRYNGGGSVSTATELTNLIAPSTQNGKVMFTTYFNSTMQSGQATILQNQKFRAKGNDGVERIYSMYDYSYAPTVAAGNQEIFAKRGAANKITRAYFLVTGSTASASELVINNLKAVMDVKVIGRTTYGKPVGFFAITIDKIDLYVPQFQTKNNLNYGDYFDGFVPDISLADDLTKDFGDVNERYLAYALNYVEKGTFTLSSLQSRMLSSLTPMPLDKENNLSKAFDEHEFKGMIEDRPRFRFK